MELHTYIEIKDSREYVVENHERTMEQPAFRLLLHIADLLWEKGFLSRDERLSIKKRIVQEHGEKRR